MLACESTDAAMALRRVHWQLSALNVQVKAVKVALALRAYNPNQPRVAAGSSDGGQWTRIGGGAQVAQGAPIEPDASVEEEPGRRGPEPLFRVVRNPLVQIDEQDPDYVYSRGLAEEAVNNVRRLEPDWSPSPGLYADTQGAIANSRAIEEEANARLEYQRAFRFGHNGPPEDYNDPAGSYYDQQDRPSTNDEFRDSVGMPTLGGVPARRKSDGTVARAVMDGRIVYGVNSDSPDYTPFDFASAVALRQQLLLYDSDVMSVNNIGQKPNDALFHAESTSIMRFVSRDMENCPPHCLNENVTGDLSAGPGASPANQATGMHGEIDKHGRAARDNSCVGATLSGGGTDREGPPSRRGRECDGLAPQARDPSVESRQR